MRILTLTVLLFINIGLKANEPVATLPFKIHRGHMYIQGSINGGKPINIVFDTGAAGNILNKSKATDLGLEFGGEQSVSGANGQVKIRVSEGNTLDIGGQINLSRQTFYLTDISHLQDTDLPVDAIIGGNVLFRYVVSIDFDRQVIELFNGRGFEAPTDFEVHEFELFPYRIPILKGRITLKNGEIKEGKYLVDTGAALTLSMNSPIVQKEKLLEKVSPNYEYVGKALGNESVELIGRLHAYEVLGEQFSGMPIRMSTTKSGVSSDPNVDGILGLEILSRFNLIFNYRSSTIYTKKNVSFDSKWKENRTGLNVIKKKDHLEVIGVVPKSAGDIAKLKLGDQIISVDGKTDMSYDEYDGYVSEKKEIVIEIRRDGETLKMRLKPFDMI